MDSDREYLSLFHFVVSMIDDDLDFFDLMRNGLAQLLRRRVSQALSESSHHLTISEVASHPVYRNLYNETCSQMRGIVESIKCAGLWIPQGGNVDEIDDVMGSIGIDELRVLRNLDIDELAFQGKLPLYYIALLKGTLSDDLVVGGYAYSLLKSVETIVDGNHFAVVMRKAGEIWQTNNVNFTFVVSYGLVLDAVCEFADQTFDDELQDQLYALVEAVPCSPNFGMLMYVNPSLKWITKCLPRANLKRVIDKSKDEILLGRFTHLCLFMRAALSGVVDFDRLLEHMEPAIQLIHEWSVPVQNEVRNLLVSLVSSIPADISKGIIDLFVEATGNAAAVSSAVFVFSEFLVIHYMKTTAPLHMPLFSSIYQLTSGTDRSDDLVRIFAAVCGNPVRMLEAVKEVKDPDVFSIIQCFQNGHSALYCTLFAHRRTRLLSDMTAAESVAVFVKTCQQRNDLTDLELSLAQISVGIDLIMRPSMSDQIVRLVTEPTLLSDHGKLLAAKILKSVVTLGRDYKMIDRICAELTAHSSLCAVSEIVNSICELADERPTKYEKMRALLSDERKRELVVGTRRLTELSILFEVIVHSEYKGVCVVFNRMRTSAADWLCAVASSMFVMVRQDSMSSDVSFAECVNESVYFVVWFSLSIIERLCETWVSALADERVDELYDFFLCPRLNECFNQDIVASARAMPVKFATQIRDVASIVERAFSKSDR